MEFAVIQTGENNIKYLKIVYFLLKKMSAKDASASGWEVGSKISFDKVLLVDDGKNTTIGTPYIVGAKVNAEILEIGRAKKS